MPTPTSLATSADALVARLRAGDPSAAEELVVRYRTRLLRYARSLLAGHAVEPEDVVQEALVRALEHLRESTAPMALDAWLHRVVRNGCWDELRRARRRPATPLEADVADPRDAHAAAEARQALREVLHDVAALPAHQRTALVNRSLGGVSHAATAHALGITPSASKMLVHRARVTLQGQRAGRMGLAA